MRIGSDEAKALKGQAAIANARLAYALYEEEFSGERFAALEAKGANRQRPLWASTGVKDPSLPDTMYVTELVVANTVNTMPEKTMKAFADHGELQGDRVSGLEAEAQKVLDDLEAVGISYDDVVDVLEREGVEKFDASWAELVETVQTALDEAKAGKDSPGEGASPDRGRRRRVSTPNPLNPLRDPQDRRLPRIAGPCVLVIFGVTGDLSTKKLMPAVYDLANRGLLPPGFALVGFARREWAHQDFAEVVHAAVKKNARTPFREEVWQQLSEGIRFVPGEIGNDESVAKLAETIADLDEARGTGGNHAFYLSIPPGLFQTVVDQLRSHGLAEQRESRWSRVVIEKPFGHDLASAQELNKIVSSVFPSSSVFRIDHYLGKETVQNLMALRFANQLFEPVWNNNYVDHVQITMAEDIGIGGRAGYFDGIGIARDVIQNHLLQLLALTAMEEPTSFEASQLRAEKQKVLAAARPPKRMDLGTARGQYAGGWAGGEKVLGYLDEDRIPQDVQDGDVRGDPDRHRQPALGRSPVLPAHRQAAGPPGHRDRPRLQTGPAPAVHQDRHRRVGLQRPGAADPAGRGGHPAVRGQGAGHPDGDPPGQHGLRVRRLVHRVLARGVRTADPGRAAGRPAAVPPASGGRAVLGDPRPDPGLLGRPAGAARALRTGLLGSGRSR